MINIIEAAVSKPLLFLPEDFPGAKSLNTANPQNQINTATRSKNTQAFIGGSDSEPTNETEMSTSLVVSILNQVMFISRSHPSPE
jgi:hypothetical protein